MAPFSADALERPQLDLSCDTTTVAALNVSIFSPSLYPPLASCSYILAVRVQYHFINRFRRKPPFHFSAEQAGQQSQPKHPSHKTEAGVRTHDCFHR